MQYFIIVLIYFVFATMLYKAEYIFMQIYHTNTLNSPHAILYDTKNESTA